ncbi:TetR/AcrR family transcriptional regulator [Mycobacteroides franklinii]|uniref:Bacterial regulatory protein, tetR family n=1 Tax=Mycobacteroides franklinii TaxID=948102 RepID=A0A4V3HUJ9_9MYCO|nr:TetR/AcrR family transcriptional regulator [Mycobacteroides franklinii]TDZ45123.1 Bacterial regulatory protein, tetR family [Mycobacteroides franklinii]TDZ48613.1 Bacterial regulatory protein, tetR family [Mycobacteroides franklinii]TDZ58793.1 Bacterial regulatory protein, tetR family [Mycobacteroides franklinii]TDZ66309.1 Bacterial regulatory protein, tetR family [Mycobacteroides franklinii]TDZ72232.1 Bacterial regulatory protein, tetR family [Mycobacteroides franklinii]
MGDSGGSLRDRQRTQIRADIRRSAFRLFVERGYDAVTTEEIASAAGVSARTFFRHIPTKEELLLGPVRHGGAAIVDLLERRPARESPDLAMINCIVEHARLFDEDDVEEWRQALLVAPEFLHKLTLNTPADRERAAKLLAARMGVDTDADMRPGLLAQLAFAAGDYGFRQWVKQTGHRQPLGRFLSEALEAVKSPHWKGNHCRDF